jgi:hypothetical protein
MVIVVRALAIDHVLSEIVIGAIEMPRTTVTEDYMSSVPSAAAWDELGDS